MFRSYLRDHRVKPDERERMEPAAYDEDAYRAKLLQKMRTSETIVYHAIFAPTDISNQGPVLVTATSLGLIHIYRLGQVMTPGYWDHVGQGEYVCHVLRDLLASVC